MDIKNTTSRPLRVPLAGGKRLFLSPGGIGQIVPKAADHPPVKALIDDGSLEIQGGKAKRGVGSANSTSSKGSAGAGGGAGGVRHTGDR